MFFVILFKRNLLKKGFICKKYADKLRFSEKHPVSRRHFEVADEHQYAVNDDRFAEINPD